MDGGLPRFSLREDWNGKILGGKGTVLPPLLTFPEPVEVLPGMLPMFLWDPPPGQRVRLTTSGSVELLLDLLLGVAFDVRATCLAGHHRRALAIDLPADL